MQYANSVLLRLRSNSVPLRTPFAYSVYVLRLRSRLNERRKKGKADKHEHPSIHGRHTSAGCPPS